MTTLLAIDPGVRVTGWALFEDGKLRAVGLSKYDGPPKAIKLACEKHREQVPVGADLRVIERMIHYPEPKRPGRSGKARHVKDATAQDLIDCATVGAYLAEGSSSDFVPAREWKGQLPKEVSEKRIRKNLTSDEEEVMDRDLAEYPAGIRHNGIDAVGQGCHYLGRRKV